MNRGFSLVELSIVLVIVGLVAGSILAGRHMIKAAELRSIATRYEEYVSAVSAFKTKYNSLPGDMKDATRFWGTMSTGTCPDATGGVGTETCNGDGNGIFRVTGTTAGQTEETFLFWQHLANAELIDGSYTGISGSLTHYDSDVGVNVPASEIRNVGWSVFWFEDIFRAGWNWGTIGSATIYQLNYLHTWEVGLEDPAGGQTHLPFLTPLEAWNIDRKIDDGEPAKGKMVVRYWNNLCAAANDGTHASDDFDARYKLEDETIQCSLMFRHAF